MTFRFSFTSDPIDLEIDDLMKGLYPEFDILERRCFDSIGTHCSSAVQENPGIEQKAESEDRTAEDVVENLSLEYFTPDYDPVEEHLREISSWTDADITERFMRKIEDTDTDKDVIISVLTSKIDDNYDDLMSCMQNIQSIDVDLCRAEMQASHGRRHIKSACGIIQSGSIKITELQKKREKLLNMVDTLKSLKALKDIHKSMLTNLSTGEVGRAAEFARSVLECLRNDAYDKFGALKNIGEGMQKNICNIRSKTDKALKRLCGRKFAAIEYESIMKSYLILDYLSDTQKVKLFDMFDDQATYIDSFGCIEGLSQRINRFQLEDIDACLHSAVMEYIYAGQQKKQQAAAGLGIAGAYSTLNAGDIVDLAEVPINLLYRRLSPDMVAPCVVRSCELLADIIHTHYLITQWHLTPFDARNYDWKFLHRCPIDLSVYGHISNTLEDDEDSGDDEEEDEEDDEEQEIALNSAETTPESANVSAEQRDSEENLHITPHKSKRSASAKLQEKRRQMTAMRHPRNSFMIKLEHQIEGVGVGAGAEDEDDIDAPVMKLIRLNSVKLAISYQSLVQSRHILWEELIRALVDMLNTMVITSSVKPDDFLAMAWAISSMIELGKEFCGSESKALQTCLEEKSKEYFQYFHMESFQIIRLMIESESWQSVPINLSLNPGKDGAESVLSMIRSNISRDAQFRIMNSALSGLGRPANTSSAASSVAPPTRRSSIRPLNSDLAGIALAEEEMPITPGSVRRDSSAPKPSVSILMLFGAHGNPFHFMTKEGAFADEAEEGSGPTTPAARSSSEDVLRDKEEVVDEFMQLLLTTEDENGAKSVSKRAAQQSGVMVVTQTALNGLVKYVAKYLHMMYLLPAASGDIFLGLCQLFDYYLTAVYNGFVPAKEREVFAAKITKMTAPPPDQLKDFEALQQYLERSLNEVAITGILKPSAAAAEAAEINNESGHSGHNSMSPMSNSAHSQSFSNIPANPFEVVKFSALLRIPAIVQFADQTSCFALTERIVAAESCWFVAKILTEIKSILLKLLPDRYTTRCDQYIGQFQLVAGQLRALIYKAVCPLLIKQPQMLTQVTDCSWDSKKLRESNHDWVTKVVQCCREVWDYMMLTEQFAESSSLVREQVWLEVCQCAFDVVLDAYAKARKVSAEGRAAMTMDVFALHEGLNTVHLCRPPRGKHYIDSYLRVAYMSEEDMMNWVQENWPSYAYRHVHGMLQQSLSSVMNVNNKKLKDAITVIDNLYEFESNGKESTSKLSNLLSSTSALASKLRNKL